MLRSVNRVAGWSVEWQGDLGKFVLARVDSRVPQWTAGCQGAKRGDPNGQHWWPVTH